MALEILQVDKRPRTSFAIALDENPVLCDGGNCSSSTQAASAPRAIEVAVQQSRKLKPMQPESRLLRSPPPLPPKGVRPLADTATFATKQSNDADGEQHYTLTLSPGEENKQLTDAIVAEVEPSVGINCRSPPPSVSPSPPSSRRLIVTTKTLSSNNSSQSPFPDKDLDRSVTQSMQNPQRNTPSSPRPIPPPRSHRQHRHSTPSHLDNTPTAQDDKTTKASPVNFLATDAGNECGRFLVDYLGSREIDQFTSIVDECAEKMMNSKPSVRSTQVVAYITTERVRLVPPRAGPLFKSLAVKSILCVNQCSKNRRIIGIVMWKPRTKPVCHLLRCTDQLISNSFFEAMFHVIQSQEVAVLSKVGPLPESCSHLQHNHSSLFALAVLITSLFCLCLLSDNFLIPHVML